MDSKHYLSQKGHWKLKTISKKISQSQSKQIQGLPDETPHCFTLALLVILPLETVIHKNSLNLFMGIARNRNFIEYDIAKR